MFTVDGLQIHYEVYGQGEPLLILNGIFMTCSSWRPFIPALSRNNCVILLDFLDQGSSMRMTHDYTQEVQVEVVRALILHLALGEVRVAGISYGGSVAMRLAIDYPQLVSHLILANCTPRTNLWLRDMGRAWAYAIASHDAHHFFKTCMPMIYSPKFYAQNFAWLKEREAYFAATFTAPVYEAFLRLLSSAEAFDVLEELGQISVPTLVISSEYDLITPLGEQEEIVRRIKKASHLLIKDAGHASMYEKPTEFVAAVLGFLAAQPAVKVV